MKTFIRNQNGFVVFVSLIMVMISMGFTVGYLHFVMGERIIFMQRFAEVRARYNAFSGISEEINGLIRSENYNTGADTTLNDREIEEMYGGYRDVYGSMVENAVTHRSQRHGRATGFSTYNSFANEPIEVEYTMEVSYRGRGFEEFMYLTNEESPGGGPWLGTSVRFGGTDALEGLVYSNDNITMTTVNGSCPEFVNYEVNGEILEYSEVYTAGNFIYLNGCQPDQIFEGVFEDSMPKIEWPPYEGQDLVKSKADYVIYGDQFIHISSTDPDIHDNHLMTEIVFLPGQFTIKQWRYIIQPEVDRRGALDENLFRDTLSMYYPKYYRDLYGLGHESTYRGDIEFQHFDFPKPANQSLMVRNETIVDDEAVIWVEGGQVQVKGTVRGRYTIATSGPEPYRMYYDNSTINYLSCNIWIMDDLVYEDSNPTTGAVAEGSQNRMGLLSGANIIVANTMPNGAMNGVFASHVKINAAMIAMDESFVIQYWQNSTAGYNFRDGSMIKGDNRGVRGSSTGNSDIRGNVIIYGSVVQDKRGYLKRNTVGPYNIFPGIGYDKDYHYDRNLRDFPPPEWPETKNADGSESLVLSGIGEYTGE